MAVSTQKSKEMEKLLQEVSPQIFPKVGDMVTGKIISIDKNEIYVDINGLASGIIRGRELYDESGEYSDLNVDDEIEATLIESENELGLMELSFRQAGHRKAWDKLKNLLNDKETISVKILNANKGGLMASYGKVTGFIPVSQLTIEHYPRVEGGDKNKILEKLQRLIGQNLEVKILDIDESEEKLIFSEKAAWEEKQKSTIRKYNVGDIIEGTVSGVVDFGAFVEFGDGLEGLVHISELAWQRIDHPKDVIKLGQKVKAEIISIEGSKISLSIKKLIKDPWEDVARKYKIGQKVEGKVLKINPYGLFVELDKDIHGLAHISELGDKKGVKLEEIAKVGDILEFVVISIEPQEHRLGLSLDMNKAKDLQNTDENKHKDKKIEQQQDKEEENIENSEGKKKEILDNTGELKKESEIIDKE
jgi:small subunit ribosomal protein S1